ncbi:hypothetical protein [Saccharomonospora iraqiensis]|uniref:hypothetical protein n=1 Tax=Saccharomonospora iraqiensis TaxID=52698 RepID=UPI0012B56A50|nr:hypothetical protein [Saccharomonospora iraqiensis]
MEPSEGFQCDYSSESLLSGVNVIRGQDMSKMSTGEDVNLSGIQATRLSWGSDTGCGVSVSLSHQDPDQQISAVSTSVSARTDKSACDIADEFAKTILDKLPG